MPTRLSPLIAAVNAASSEYLLQSGSERIEAKITPVVYNNKQGLVDNYDAVRFAETYHGQSILRESTIFYIADYLELSSWGHIMDSWRYLSQSAFALLLGSRDKALHLAYYAELRAAIAILAMSGICILKGKHFAIDQNGQLYWFNGSTHEVTWAALTEWVDLANIHSYIIDALDINNVLGIQWVDMNANALSFAKDISKDWVKNWCVDIGKIKQDRTARNKVSYRPSIPELATKPLMEKELKIITTVNSVISINENIKLLLACDFSNIAAKVKYINHPDFFWDGEYLSDVTNWLVNHNAKTYSLKDARKTILDIKKTYTNDLSLLLESASIGKKSACAVFSRAFFLLYLASALILKHRNELSSRSANGVIEWPDELIKQFGLNSQLWDQSSLPVDFSLLTNDTIDSIDDLEAYPKHFFGHAKSRCICGHSLWQSTAQELIDLCHLEKYFLVMSA